MRGNSTRRDSGGHLDSGADPYRLARVLVFDVYEKTRRARRQDASSAELRRAAVSTANSLLTGRSVAERHRRAALEGLDHVSQWLNACVEEGSLSSDQWREIDGLRVGLLEALEPEAPESRATEPAND